MYGRRYKYMYYDCGEEAKNEYTYVLCLFIITVTVVHCLNKFSIPFDVVNGMYVLGKSRDKMTSSQGYCTPVIWRHCN